MLCPRTGGACCVCILYGFPLYFTEAEPPWTGRSLQYQTPFWEPLGSGTLAAGARAVIDVTVSVGHLVGSNINPNYVPAACMGAYADENPQPGGNACKTIDIIEPTPSDVPGDVTCDQHVDSLDALFVLQNVAAILPAFPCPDLADVNHDGTVSVVDAALILQFSAGLLSQLPP